LVLPTTDRQTCRRRRALSLEKVQLLRKPIDLARRDPLVLDDVPRGDDTDGWTCGWRDDACEKGKSVHVPADCVLHRRWNVPEGASPGLVTAEVATARGQLVREEANRACFLHRFERRFDDAR
jgi:hypothetical protein